MSQNVLNDQKLWKYGYKDWYRSTVIIYYYSGYSYKDIYDFAVKLGVC